MNRLLALIQGLFFPQDTDDTMLLWAKEILGALLILAFFYMLAQLAALALGKWGKRLASFTSTDLDDRILQRIIPHVSRLLITLGFYLAAQSLPLPGKAVPVVSGIIFIVLVVIVFNLAYHILDELLKWYLAGKQSADNALLSRQMVPIVEKIATLFMMGIALITILTHFNYDVFSLVTALGIGSLAIGMAAKDTLAHMISGFTLMLDRPFHIGDRIKLSNGTVGDVIDIGLRSTKIQGLDATLLIIPNADLCNSTVINMVRPSSVTQGRISVGVGYGSNIEQVKNLLVELAREDAETIEEPGPLAQFTSFGESALNVVLLFWVSDPNRIGAVTDRLNCAILNRFRESQIEIPFPVRTVIMEKELPCPTE
ncbi:mechanosensitive ion channel family protein [Pelotalea chapellei]